MNKVTKIMVAVMPILIIIGGFIYLSLRSNRLTKEFYQMRISAIVIRESDWKRSSIDYVLDNGMKLNFLAPATGTLAIGDSIFKPANTYVYYVYRKNFNYQYELLKSYDYSERN